MQPAMTDAVKLILQYGSPAILAIVIVMICSVIYVWLIKADPVRAMRGMLNIRKERLETLRKQDFLSEEARALAELELRQRSLYQLTGIFYHRLQEPAVQLITRYKLRARYLAQWRRWLDEKDGQIVFERKPWRRAWRFFFCFTLVNTMMVFLATGFFAFHFGFEFAAPLLFALTAFWWLPWLLFTSVPPPAMTEALEARLREFNCGQPDVPASSEKQGPGTEVIRSCSECGTTQ